MKSLLYVSLSTLTFSFFSLGLQGQNVGINATGATPDASAILDVAATDMGVLIPRVSLSNTASASPITSPQTSLLVYNAASSGSGSTAVTPGYYYWNGSAWQRLLNGESSDWELTGNAGTSASTNFIGTTDAVDLVVRTNNSERMRIESGGDVGIGLTNPSVNLHVDGGGDANFGSGSGYVVIGPINGENLVMDHDEILARDNGGESTLALQAEGGNLSIHGNQGGSTVMYLEDDGDFGVGTTSPDGKAHFTTDTAGDCLVIIEADADNISELYNPRLRLQQDGGAITGYLGLEGQSNVLGPGTLTNSLLVGTGPNFSPFPPHLQFLTADTVRMTLRYTNGYIGINTTAPTAELSVNGAANKIGGGTWATFSDRRLKKDVRPFTDGTAVLMGIKPSWFSYNGLAGIKDTTTQFVGVIAQEIKEVAPYTVKEVNYTDPNTNESMAVLQYDPNALIYLLVNTVQEQEARLHALEQKLRELDLFLGEQPGLNSSQSTAARE